MAQKLLYISAAAINSKSYDKGFVVALHILSWQGTIYASNVWYRIVARIRVRSTVGHWGCAWIPLTLHYNLTFHTIISNNLRKLQVNLTFWLEQPAAFRSPPLHKIVNEVANTHNIGNQARFDQVMTYNISYLWEKLASRVTWQGFIFRSRPANHVRNSRGLKVANSIAVIGCAY